MATTYTVLVKQPFDVALGDDVAKYLTNLSSDPTNEAGTAVVASTSTGTVTVPFENVLAVIETTS